MAVNTNLGKESLPQRATQDRFLARLPDTSGSCICHSIIKTTPGKSKKPSALGLTGLRPYETCPSAYSCHEILAGNRDENVFPSSSLFLSNSHNNIAQSYERICDFLALFGIHKSRADALVPCGSTVQGAEALSTKASLAQH